MKKEKLSRQDLKIIVPSDQLTSTDLTRIVGGIGSNFIECDCTIFNRNRDGGDCDCDLFNRNKKPTTPTVPTPQ